MMITQNDLRQLTGAIWESTLGLEVQPIPGPDLSGQEASTLIGRVQITGAWLGTVLLECSRELARKVARAMFGLDAEDPTGDQIRDALGEITNMTAGNLKSLVGGHCHLSIPQVTERVVEPPAALEDAVLTRQAFDCQGELLVVTILAGEATSRWE
jgi:chemotaxis protein CheY-P-specific phosphatase CheC